MTHKCGWLVGAINDRPPTSDEGRTLTGGQLMSPYDCTSLSALNAQRLYVLGLHNQFTISYVLDFGMVMSIYCFAIRYCFLAETSIYLPKGKFDMI